MSSQWGSQKLFKCSVSRELSLLFLMSKVHKLDNVESHLPIFKVFTLTLLIVNLSLNETLLIFLLYPRQTWMTHLILAISLWEIIPSNWKGFCYTYAWLHSLCQRETSFCTELIFKKLWGFLFVFSAGFTSFGVLLCFSFMDHCLRLLTALFSQSSSFRFIYFFWP